MNEQDPNTEIVKIKYFTAHALGKFATHGNESSIAQQTYHRALNHLYPDLIEIIYGVQACDPKPLPEYQKGVSFDRNKRQWIWFLEEEMTDVEIALSMYRDAIKNECHQIVLCSNDSDMMPALKAIRTDLPAIKIGVLMPIPQPKAGEDNKRRVSGSTEWAHWCRRYILDDELMNAILPDKIPTNRKPIIKPSHW